MSVLYKQSTYEDRIVSQSLNLANMFLTSSNAQYWAGKNNHHGVITSFDWFVNLFIHSFLPWGLVDKIGEPCYNSRVWGYLGLL